MRTTLAALLNLVHQLALAVWLGGILTIGAVTAPAVFGSAKQAGDTHLGTPLYDFAALAMGEAFRRFNYLVVVAGALMLVCGWAYGSLAGLCPRRLTVRAVVTALAWGLGLWLTFALYPAMIAARSAGQVEAFDGLHHTYSHATQGQLMLLIGVATLTSWLHLDRSPAPTAVPNAEVGVRPPAVGAA